jgi:hypothetical protein
VSTRPGSLDDVAAWLRLMVELLEIDPHWRLQSREDFVSELVFKLQDAKEHCTHAEKHIFDVLDTAQKMVMAYSRYQYPFGGGPVDPEDRPAADEFRKLIGVIERLACSDAPIAIREATAATGESGDDARSADDAEKASLEARALAMLVDHPDWSDTRIADTLGCNRGSLYRLEKYKAARQQMKLDGTGSTAHGSKADGRLEAWDAEQ